MFGNHLSEPKELKLNTIEEAIADIKAGKVVIVVDDEDRENEGDFICAAETVTPEIINFMATYARGLICTPIDEKRADDLELTMMVNKNSDPQETAFTISIDLIGQGCTTGISTYDRATGIRALVDPNTKASDFARPGHIFPLRAKTGGVLRRTGHTEATIDLARLAGLHPIGVCVEILNEDGTMARLPQLLEIAKQHNLKIVSIEDLVAYRMRNERIVKKEYSVEMNTKFGTFEIIAFTQITTGDTHLAIKKGTWGQDDEVLVRVHSSSETGDILGTLFEDYGMQLQKSMEIIANEGKGVLIYMRHGEKGNSILNRLKSYALNDVSKGEGTKSTEQRDYGIGAQIIREMNISKIRLITNSTKRRIGLIGYGLEIVENINLEL